MEFLEFIRQHIEVIAIILSPFVTWYITIRYQERKEKRKDKMDLFLALMEGRKANPVSQKWVDALNKIDVIFQDSNKVRAAWRAYFDSLHPKSQHFDNQNSFHLDVLSEIAQDLGYKNLKQTELDRFYCPQVFADDYYLQKNKNLELHRVLHASEHIGNPRKPDSDKKS